MKKSKNIYCILLFAVLGITGCSEEKMAPLPEPVPLRMSINSTDLVMGETLEITFDVTGTDEGMKAMNEDVSIKLSATTGKRSGRPLVVRRISHRSRYEAGRNEQDYSGTCERGAE